MSASLEKEALRDVVTVVRDKRRPLGKRFDLKAGGTVDKQATVTIGRGTAVMHHVPTAEKLAELLHKVGNDPNAALILDGFVDIEIGEEFEIWSDDQLREHLGVKDRAGVVGVHIIDGRKIVARLKENIVPGSWCLADRDIDEHTPDHFRSLDYDGWVDVIEKIMPGFKSCDRVHAASSSARVLRDGKPVGGGNGHTFFRVANACDIERARTALRISSIEQELAWLKPRISKKKGDVCGHSDTTILDLSVMLPGRLVFEGRPTASKGLEVTDPIITVHAGSLRNVDTSRIEALSPQRVHDAGSKLGLPMQLRDDGVTIDSYDLRLDTVVETKNIGPVAIETLYLVGIEKERCQAPFRASESWAAFVGEDHEGRPFVHDSGTGTNHWLANEDWLPIRAALLTNEFEDLTTPKAVVAAATAEAAVVQATATRFTPEPWHQFANGPPPQWIIRDVLPQAGLGVIFGESGSGKSFFTLDLVMAVARGVPWRNIPVKRGRVVYICAEGVAGFRRRLTALAVHHGIGNDEMQLDVIPTAPDLMGADHKALAAAIGRADIIVVDTLAQTTPGANENSGEDMGKALGHCKTLHEATGALVLLVHHSGKDAARGARGWSGIKGACDVELEVTCANGPRMARVSKQKDGESGECFPFRLHQVPVGVDEYGSPVTSCVVVDDEGPPPRQAPKGEVQRAVMVAFNDKAATLGRVPRKTLIEHAIEKLPEPLAGAKDRRRDKASRALMALMDQRFLLLDGDDVTVC